ALRAGGVEVAEEHFFDTITVRVPGRAEQVLQAAEENGVNLRLVDADTLRIAADETTVDADLVAVLTAFGLDAGSLPAS
ncbi:hypothetical protein GUG87_24745, partial [Xanthomonas citri pv. citri]|nr:hypothetical protein [Xanthomonas citri pv. citri]